VLGPDGRCSVCERPAGASGEGAESSADAGGQPGNEASADDAPPPEMTAGAASSFDPNRRLCDDGSCVGVVGADGVCGTCGRKAD
jgi:hypothetical protein